MNGGYSEDNQINLSLQEPLIEPESNHVKWEIKDDDDAKESLLVSTKANSSKFDSDSSVSSKEIPLLFGLPRFMKRKGDQQRKWFDIIIFTCLTLTVFLLYQMRHSKWTTTFLIVESKDPYNNTVLSRNSTFLFDARFETVEEWWNYIDGFFLFGLIVRLYLNVFPILKLCLHAMYWITVMVGPRDLRYEGCGKVMVVNDINDASENEDNNENDVDQDFEYSRYMKIRYALIVFLARGYEFLAKFDLYLNLGPKQNLILYMLMIVQIATSHTFTSYNVDYTIEWDMDIGLVYTQLVLFVSDLTMLFFRNNYLRWKRRQRNCSVLNAIIEDEGTELNRSKYSRLIRNPSSISLESESTAPDLIVIRSLLQEESEIERENSRRSIFCWWRDLSVQERSTIWILVAFFCRYFLTFMNVIKFNYSGYNAQFLDETSESLSAQDIIEVFSERAHSKADSWIGVIFYFEVILVPQLLLSASILIKLIRHSDKESKWIYPLYTFISYFQFWGGWDTFTYAVILSYFTLKYAVRQISEENEMCSELVLETGERCFEAEAVFQPGTWVLIVYYFSWGYAILQTNIDLMTKLEPLGDLRHYGNNNE